ncbi:MAG: sugar transferase [Dissulfurispiraceae bacterium]
MKLHVEKALENDRGHERKRSIAAALARATRDLDIKGWFEPGSKIGVILTETGAADMDILRQRVLNSLSAEPSLMNNVTINITFRVFPDDISITGDNESANTVFYSNSEKNHATTLLASISKRIIDIIGSIAAIIIFSPFFLIIPILIKLTSKGPVLFKQDRLGQYGKKFAFFKFRTMSVNNDPKIHQDYIKKLICEKQASSVEDGDDGKQCVYKIKNDPRVTPIGHFLRKSSLDEIPQFINVLKGEMSMVGPRPPIAYEVENYDLWHLRRVLEVKPGITGLWQVNGRSRTTFDEMVRMDIQYVTSWSPWLDIKILFQTVRVVLSGKGGY